MQRYKVTLTGGPTSMLMHADDVGKADMLSAYRASAKSKKDKGASKAGDDRTPAWSYWTYLNTDGTALALTDLQLRKCLMKGATEFKMAGKGKKTLKSASNVLIEVRDQYWPILVQQTGKKGLHPIKLADIEAIGPDAPFEKHVERCREMGIILDVRRATVGQSKHVRVRPRFAPGWQASGEIMVLDESIISEDTLSGILEYCGDFVGLGDWRPSAPKSPGPHGRFTAEIQELK